MLRYNKHLHTLKLGHNYLSTRGGITIIEALGANKSLTSLDLSENGLGPEVGLAISQVLTLQGCLIQNLNLSNNKLGSRGVSAIGEALKVS